jgi:hypothetical protein
MSLTKKEATNFFNYLEKSSIHDNKITRSDMEKALSVDTDGDGKITDILQTRTLSDGVTVTSWTEKEIVTKNVEQWIANAGENSSDKWDDEAIDINEFLEMLKLT